MEEEEDDDDDDDDGCRGRLEPSCPEIRFHSVIGSVLMPEHSPVGKPGGSRVVCAIGARL